jgi:ABC-2 type transport system ATP-binding protein
VIEVRGVSKRYGDFVAVRDVSFEVERGEVVGFLGPNGAGKTTTMRMLTGFLPASSGSVRIAGHDMATAAGDARRAIGYLPETPPVYPEMRVDDYMRFVARIKDVPRAEQADKVDRAIAACGLEDVRRRLIGRLSRGYRQRVGLAQAIVHEPPVLVLDEPTSGLDPMQMVEIRRLIRELADEGGRTVILSTHILPEVEAICRRVLLISYGEIRVDGTLEDVVGQGTLEDVFLREAAPPPAPEEPRVPPGDPGRDETRVPAGAPSTDASDDA